MKIILQLSILLVTFINLVNAQQSPFLGKWTLTTIQMGKEIKEVNSGIIFEENGILQLGFFDMEEIIEAGTWKYDKNKNSIYLSSTVEKEMNGKAEIIKITENELQYKKDGAIYSLIKYLPTEELGNVLDFSEADFFTEDGDYKYENEFQKLPWQDSYAMISELDNLKQLVYKYSLWNNDTKTFDSSILRADVLANKEKMTLSIDYIFFGYDRYNLPEDTELPPNREYSNLLYPEVEFNFRITGTEEIETPAGTFSCTVIEAVNEEVLKKMWMINNKPGIYAKVIIEKPGMFGMFYHGIFELKEIK